MLKTLILLLKVAPKAFFFTLIALSLYLAIRRRGMWVPRIFFIASFLFLYHALPPPKRIGAILIQAVLWLLILFWLAHFITPLPRNHPEFRRSRLLLWWYIVRRIFSLHPPAYVVEEGKVEERIAGARFRNFLGRAGFIERLSFPNSPVLIRSDSVAILQLFVTPSRIVGNQMVFRPNVSDRRGEVIEGTTGPGTTICFLDLYENVRGVIDLRPRREVRTVRAHSADNFEVDLQLLMDFSLSQAFREERLEYVYIYDPAEVLRAFYLQVQSPGEPEIMHWDDIFLSVAQAQLSKVVSCHLLSDFYGDSHPTNSSQVLEEDLSRALEFARFPGHLSLLRVTLTGVAQKAIEHSLRNWEARVEVREKPMEAEAEALYWREINEARFSFFRELMEKISEIFAGARESDLETALSIHMAKIVENLAYSLAEKGLLSTETAKTLERIGVYKSLSPGGS